MAGLLALACGGTTAPVPWPVDLAWRPFYWARAYTGGTGFERAAVLLPQRVGRADTGVAQLDLAGSGTMPLGYPSPQAEASVRAGALHGLLAGADSLQLSGAGESDPQPVLPRGDIGTLGLPLYEHAALVFDFTQQRFATLPAGTDLGAVLGPRAANIPIEFDGDRVRLALQGDEGPVDALLDTGLSPFPIWATERLWRVWTGLDPQGQAVRRYRLPSRRGDLVFVGGVVRAGWRIGGAAPGRVEAVFLESGPPGAMLEQWPFKVQAVLGSSLLATYAIAGIDIPRRRLVLLR